MITASYTIPGMHVRDHVERVPLRWSDPDDGRTVSVFARELVDPVRRHEDLPCLLFLQGGPGGKAPRPVERSGWVARAMRTHRVILLDQRGTGRSTRIDGAAMAGFGSAAEAADHLARFRADSIVADAEHLRRTVFGNRRWSTLGQSFGGFITLTYLSQAPEGLSACYVTGGLPGVSPDPREVYRRTYPRVEAKNRAMHRRYPHLQAIVDAVADRVAAGDVRLPDGDLLTVRRLQSLGMDLGMKPGSERLLWLFDEAWADEAAGRLSDTFLRQVTALTSYADNPLFAALHESIYADPASGATRWAAQREGSRLPRFAPDARPLLLTGEMVYPWMFEEVRALRPFGPAVESLAGRTDWSPLYDRERLAANEVPVAAAVYFEDMYVDAGLQLQTAAAVGGLQPWVTNEYEHDGLGSERVLERLMQMVDDVGGGVREG